MINSRFLYEVIIILKTSKTNINIGFDSKFQLKKY